MRASVRGAGCAGDTTGPGGDLAGSAVQGGPGAPLATERPPGGTVPGPGAVVATGGPGIRYIDTGGVPDNTLVLVRPQTLRS